MQRSSGLWLVLPVVAFACSTSEAFDPAPPLPTRSVDTAPPPRGDGGDPKDAGADGRDTAPKGPAFATVWEDQAPAPRTGSDGDLWASCWGDDDALYVANGDGRAFGPTGFDIAVSRVDGTPASGLGGTTLSGGGAVARIWTAGSYNRKPTGLLCSGSELYVAVQDLAFDFEDAPAASISRSVDKGRTWTWNNAAPMFSNHVFTTIFFVDYGRAGMNAIDGFVYAYGLDGNWRQSNGRVPDPTAVFLARVPRGSVQARAAWEFFTGLDGAGKPTWSPDIGGKKAVLEDARRLYTKRVGGADATGLGVIGQGGVVYVPALRRYIFSSWSEFSHEFYEAQAPWGPFRHFFTQDFGPQSSWNATKQGGYSPTIPSKFVRPDGRELFVQANVLGVAGVDAYGFTLRRLYLEPWTSTTPQNVKSSTSLGRNGEGVTPFVRALHIGNRAALNDGVVGDTSADSWNDELKTDDWWGYTFSRAYNLNRLRYVTGAMFPDGGWFSAAHVEVRQGGRWIPVKSGTTIPPYPANATTAAHTAYVFRFDDTWGDGIRVVGVPGGTAAFTSISELDASFE